MEGEVWKLEEVQNYLDFSCMMLGIPNVRIASEEFFNLEQLEAVLFI